MITPFLMMLVLAIYIYARGVHPYFHSVRARVICAIVLLLASTTLGGGVYLTRNFAFDTLYLSRFVSFVLTGFLMLFVCVLLRDVLLFLFFIVRKIMKREEKIKIASLLDSKQAMCSLFILSVLLTTYGIYEGLKVPDVQKVSVKIPNLPSQLKGFTIVQITDTHIGSGFDGDWLVEVVSKINTLNADVVVGTGDLMDGSVEQLGEEFKVLKDIKSRYGAYWAVGNHEYYSGLPEWYNYFKESGFPLLINESVTLDVDGAKISFVGISDTAANRVDEAQRLANPEALERVDHEKALKNVPDEAVKVLLAHQPKDARENATYGYDLQLSGHTHGGLVFAFFPIIAGANNGYVSGLYDVGSMQMYLSRGTGLWGFVPLRLGVPSEITLITLE